MGYDKVEEWRLWWIFAYLSASGECHVEQMPEAWTLFQQLFLENADGGHLTIARVTQKLIDLTRRGVEDSESAELCLRCYISNQVRSACDRLAGQFGYKYRFSGRDLWPFVLDDAPPRFRVLFSPSDYQSLADRIVETFDPDRGSLNTYIDRLVKRESELKLFLLERGVYLATDWGILNNTTVSHIEKVLRDFYKRSTLEIQQACLLLKGFHTVYRRDRLKARLRDRQLRRCVPPTSEQLGRIAQFVGDRGNPSFRAQPDEVVDLLQTLATDLREHYICVQTGNLPSMSISDARPLESLPDDRLPDPDGGVDNEIDEFLVEYRQQSIECLEEAIARVIESRVEGFRQRQSKTDPQKGQRQADNFLAAMRLHQCEGLSMSEIALKLGLKGQYTVSRLLDRKALRADIRHQTLLLLRDRIQELAARYLDPDRLQNLDRLLDELLGERIDEMLGSAENILTDRVCRYFNRR
ncbi:MAG: hypothetical protein SWY16_17815 [Cyanobacteriota bacterium]|nr:hypothetical protein [Cyanobacteriota bacterium]